MNSNFGQDAGKGKKRPWTKELISLDSAPLIKNEKSKLLKLN